jgi:hypothetical protein
MLRLRKRLEVMDQLPIHPLKHGDRLFREPA